MVSSKSTNVIEALGLSKVYKDFWLRPRVAALANLDLSIPPRQVFGLLGPNGSGKSTTIKLLLGLLKPTKGLVTVFGKLPSDVSTKKRIGYLPEESYLYRFLNARETLEYYGRIFQLDSTVRRKRIDMLLSMVGLDAVQRRPVGEYSKGMQRRIGLAQALINDPDLLILDEPTTGLDPLGSRQIKDIILHLRDRGKTILLSSHLLADVEDVCDRVTILYGGKVRAAGTCQELLTVEDTTVIETDHLKPSTIKQIEKVIHASEGKAIRSVHAPRQKLESLFLKIVHQAQKEGLATHGAGSGGPVADFLAAPQQPAEAQGMQVIEQLTAEAAPAIPAAQIAAEQAKKEERREKERSAGVIEQLTSGPAAPSAPADAAPVAKPAAPMDRGVIDDLLGGDRR